MMTMSYTDAVNSASNHVCAICDSQLIVIPVKDSTGEISGYSIICKKCKGNTSGWIKEPDPDSGTESEK